MNRIFTYVREHWHHLVQLHDTPHSIAGGVAIGILLGFTPLFSIKTLLAILIAWAFRCSRVAAAIAVTLHDVAIPLLPLLFRVEYGIGYWLLSHPHQWPLKFKADHLRLDQWLHWATFVKVGWPMLLGSLVIGIPVAIAAFGLTLRIVTRHQEHRRRAAAAAQAQVEPGSGEY
ncbi:MAG: DUF2062 domain-containing protein [Verrucomicrobiota bacterium]